MGSLDQKQRHEPSLSTIQPKPTDRQPTHRQPTKVERLQENWFATAADVAAMSREDRHSLQVPLRVWTHIAAALGAGGGPVEPSGSLLLSGGGALAVTAAPRPGGAEEAALDDEDDDEEEEDELDADIMLRRAPPRRRTFARENIRVTKRVRQAPYGLRVGRGVDMPGLREGARHGG